MVNLSPVKKAHVSALMSWNGMEYSQALDLANTSSCEELNSQSYASDSIMAAKQGIEKHLLKGQEIKIEYLMGTETAPEGYFENLSALIFQNMSREQVMTGVMVILKEIHNSWVSSNAKKYNRDAENQDKRLFQHLPIQMIGMEEVAKDLMFLAPTLDVLGINVGEMQNQAWGQFIPTEEVANTYAIFSEGSFKKHGITSDNLAEKLPDIIESYAPLQGNSEIDNLRKQYMLKRVNILSNQVKSCLGLDNENSKNI